MNSQPNINKQFFSPGVTYFSLIKKNSLALQEKMPFKH